MKRKRKVMKHPIQSYKESEDQERAGWYEEKIGWFLSTFTVFLKQSGILEVDQYEVDEWSMAMKIIDDFVTSGSYPDFSPRWEAELRANFKDEQA
jgi:hypothetical protein